MALAPLGLFLVYLTGWLPSFTYISSALLALGITTIYTILLLIIPETPPYLIKTGKHIEAMKNLAWIRGSHDNSVTEYNNIQDAYDEQEKRKVSFSDSIKKKSGYIPCIILLLIMALQQLSGINALVSYAQEILKSSGFQNDPALAPLLCIGVTESVAYIVALVLSDIFGRKVMFMLSAALMTVSCVSMGVYFHFLAHHYNTLAMISVVVFIVGFSVGYGPLSFVIMAEILPLKVRGVLAGVSNVLLWACGALVTGCYLKYSSYVGADVAWWTFASVNLCGLLFVAMFLPETKGKTLEAIENDFNFHYHLCAWS